MNIGGDGNVTESSKNVGAKTKKTAIDVIDACFPGGIMADAPKLRTMDILYDMEEEVSRGPYSGCLGYISLKGCMDMNFFIRSTVLTPVNSVGDTSDGSAEEEEVDVWKASIGCGGAIMD